MGLYRWIDLALTTRLHGAVFSAAARTPFLAISYLPKVRGFLRHIGMEEWSLELEDFQDEQLLFQKMVSLIARREDVVKRLIENLSCAEQRAQEHFDTMVKLMRHAEAA